MLRLDLAIWNVSLIQQHIEHGDRLRSEFIEFASTWPELATINSGSGEVRYFRGCPKKSRKHLSSLVSELYKWAETTLHFAENAMLIISGTKLLTSDLELINMGVGSGTYTIDPSFEVEKLFVDGNTILNAINREYEVVVPSVTQPLSHESDVDLTEYLKAMLHPQIMEVQAAYFRGEYGPAIFEAFKRVEMLVRSAGNFSEEAHGIPLMRSAFKPVKAGVDAAGPLTNTGTPLGEQEAVAALFAGAIGSYKNPQSHRHHPINDSFEAAEILIFASHLLRLVERRVQATCLPKHVK